MLAEIIQKSAAPSRQEISSLAISLAKRFLDKPGDTKRLAKQLGLWGALKESLDDILHVAHARVSPDVCIEYCFRADTGALLKQSEFHIEWQRLLGLPDTNVLVMAPRGHGKSIQIMGRVIYEIGRNPLIRVKIICSIDGHAKKIVSLISQNISDNPRVKKVFPGLELAPEDGVTKDAITVKRERGINRDPTVQAHGVLSAAAGGRADLLVCDDVVDYANAVTNPAMRVKIIEVVETIWLPMKVPTGKLWWLCTPYHVMDATHVFRERGGMFDEEWKHPAISYEPQYDKKGAPKLDDNGNPIVKEIALWPAVWNLKALAKKCAEIGLRAFTQQYLLRVQSDEDLTFKPEDLQPSYDSMLWRVGQYLPIDGLQGMIPDEWPTYGGVDLASTAGTKSAYTVIFTLARNPDNKRLYLKEIIRKKLTWPQLMKELQSGFDRHHWQHCFVEDNQYQRVVVQELDENHKHIPVSGVHTGINKQDPKVGLPGMSTAFSKGLFVLPSRDFEKMTEGDTSPLGIFWNELSNHPGAKHSDTVMALWLAYRCYLTYGVSTVEGFHAAVAAS